LTGYTAELMFRRPYLVVLLVALAALGVAASGCDSGPTTCSVGEIEVQEIEVGDGVIATADSRVNISYSGALEDGRLVASQMEQTVNLSETSPPGFRQGVAGMRENGERRFTLPPNLGFGPGGGPVGIPACAVIIFTVTLHDVVPQGCANNAPTVTIEESAIGTGIEATATSRVTVNSTLSLVDGTVIESRTNAQLLLSDPSIIAGIRQGIPGMREGGRRRVLIPPNLAYGQAGLPSQGVPSCATLLYDVELITVVP
jgi:FKBP-type peptidyl-prolyl cis-trans isomerase